MFSSECDSDFEIDEEFLNDAFDCKSNESGAVNAEKKPIIVNSFRNSSINETSVPVHTLNVGHKPSVPTPGDSVCLEDATSLLPQEEPIQTASKTSRRSSELTTTPKIPDYGSRIVRQRKFPGPAGLLPDVQSTVDNVAELLDNNSDLRRDSTSAGDTEPVICSQNSTACWTQAAPWLRLSSDFNTDSRLTNLNVAWVKRRATSRQLTGRKVPFLAVVLKHIDYLSTDPSVVLQDNTGTINGTLHRDVLEEYASQLKAGSALVLHQMGVVSTGFPTRRHYLNITLNNIISIYDCPSEDSNSVRVTKVKNIPISQLQELMNSSELPNVVSPSINVLNSSGDVSSLFSCFSARNKNETYSPGEVFENIPSNRVSLPPKVNSENKRDFSPTVQKNDNDIKTPKARFTPKVPRMSINMTNIHNSVLVPAVNDDNNDVKSAVSVPEGDVSIAENIFQDFDCSSLFEDF